MNFAPKSDDTRNYIKFQDGEPITGVFRGEMFHFRIHWNNNNRSVVCEAPNCEPCKAGVKSSRKFRLNFIVKDGGKFVAKICEQGAEFHDQLLNLDEGGFKIEQTIFRILRKGTKMDTTYSIMPAAPNFKVTPEMEKLLAAVPLNDISHHKDSAEKAKPKENGFDNQPVADLFAAPEVSVDSEIPF